MRCFGRDSDARGRRRLGFTLLELVAVLAIVALIAAVTVPAVAGALAGSKPRESLREVRAELAMARAEAMRAARGVEASVGAGAGSIRVRYLDREREIAARWLAASGGGEGASQRVAFDSMGLASRKELVFSDGRDGAGTIWLIPLDPVSGAAGEPRMKETTAR